MAGPWGSMRRNFLTRHTSCVGLGIKKKDAPLKPDFCQPVMRATKRSPFTKGDPTPGEHCACFPPVFQTQALSHHPAWQEYMTQHMFSCLKLKMSIGRPARLAETKEFFFAQDWSSRSDGVPCVSGDSGAGARFPCLAECWGDVPKISFPLRTSELSVKKRFAGKDEQFVPQVVSVGGIECSLTPTCT